MGKNVISGSVELDVAPQAAWSASINTARWPDWTEGTERVIGATDLMLGSRYQEVNQVIGPWRVTTSWEVTQWRPEELHEHRGKGLPFLAELVARFTIEPTQTGTRFIMAFEFVPRGWLGRVACALMLQRRLARSLQRSLVQVQSGAMFR